MNGPLIYCVFRRLRSYAPTSATISNPAFTSQGRPGEAHRLALRLAVRQSPDSQKKETP